MDKKIKIYLLKDQGVSYTEEQFNQVIFDTMLWY